MVSVNKRIKEFRKLTGRSDFTKAKSAIALTTSSKEILEQRVFPCVMMGSMFPSQQSSSTHRHPNSNAWMYISTEECEVSWFPVR